MPVRKIAPLIDEGEIEEAKSALHMVLNTLVVTKHVIALPLLRAQLLLAKAETILEGEDWSAEDATKLPGLVDAVVQQFEMAELLGYADAESLEGLRAAWTRVSAHVTGGTAEEEWRAFPQDAASLTNNTGWIRCARAGEVTCHR